MPPPPPRQRHRRHLRDLLNDRSRCETLIKEEEGIYLDMSRQRMTEETMHLLLKLAVAAQLKEKIAAMFAGEIMNVTEKRPVLHVATRAARDQKIMVDGKDVVPEVWKVLDSIASFSKKVMAQRLRRQLPRLTAAQALCSSH